MINESQAIMRKRRRGPVIGMTAIQVAVAAVTSAFWVGLMVTTGVGSCTKGCDYDGADAATSTFWGILVGSFVVTAFALVNAPRARRSLIWVPAAGSAVIVIGFLVSSNWYSATMR